MFGLQVKKADDVDGALSVRITVTVLVIPPPVTVMVPLLVPTMALVVFTLTITVLLLDPEVLLTVNQLAFLLTVHAVLDVTERD